MKQHLAISAIGSDRTGMVHDLTRIVADCGGSISESRMTALGAEFAILMLVSGNWHALARLETELKKLADTGNLSLQLRRTEQRTSRSDLLPYSVDVVCLDQSGIVSKLSGFFSSRGIDIAELNTRSYAAAHTGAPMFAVQMIVNVPSRIHLSTLREEFLEFVRPAQPRRHSRTGEDVERSAAHRHEHSTSRQGGHGILVARHRRQVVVPESPARQQRRGVLLSP